MTISSRELAFGWRGVRFLVVDTAETGIAACVAQWAPSGSACDEKDAPEVRYVIEPWQPAWGARGTRYRVSRDGAVRHLGSSVDRLAQWVRADVDEQASRRGGGGLLIRAAAVVWRERAILIPGSGRTGTSTLVAELVRCGATRCADDLAVLDDAGRVHPYGGTRGPAAPLVALVVATTYRPELSWQPRVVRGARAVLAVIDSAHAQHSEPGHTLRRAARLAPALVTLQGPRGEAAIAAPRILAALDEWLDGHSPARAVTPGAARLLARARRALAAQGRPVLASDTHEVV